MFKNGLLALCALYVFPIAAADTAERDHWHNRPNVLAAGSRLAQEVEHFDESLHNVHAPTHVIQKVHHFEETVTEFVEMVRMGASKQIALGEFNHIRQDIRMIRDELYKHPNLMTHGPVAQEWYHVWSSYRKLDHEMFMRQLSREDEQKLDQEIRDVDAAH